MKYFKTCQGRLISSEDEYLELNVKSEGPRFDPQPRQKKFVEPM
jgi:hypothetical protein